MQTPQRYILGSILIILITFGAAVALKKPQTEVEVTQNNEAAPTSQDCRDFSERILKVGGKDIPVSVADTKEDRAEGLSGCLEVPAGKGMYFTFEPASTVTFWMKDMVISIDILWVKDGKIVGIEENVSPEPGVIDDQLRRYRHTSSITGTLELAAGQARALGLEVGEDVAF